MLRDFDRGERVGAVMRIGSGTRRWSEIDRDEYSMVMWS